MVVPKLREINETNWYPIGLMYLYLHSINMFTESTELIIPEDSFFWITLDPYILESKIIHGSQCKVKQQFYIPIHNHFNEVLVELVYLKSDSWFRDNKKELVYASVVIWIPTLYSEELWNNNEKIDLPLELKNTVKK